MKKEVFYVQYAGTMGFNFDYRMVLNDAEILKHNTKVLELVCDDFIRDASTYPAVNDLMIAADLLITDYSAIAFDFSILCKPILCYTYDCEDYFVKRETYFTMNDRYPNPVCMIEQELLDRIRNLDPDSEAENSCCSRDRFISYGKRCN